MPSPLVFASLLAGGTSVALAAYAWRGRDEPGGAAFSMLMVGAAVWSLSYAVALVVFDPTLRLAFEVPIEVGKAIIAPAWFAFALGYTGRGEYLTRRTVAVVMAFPVATIFVVGLPALRPLIWTNYHVVPTLGAATVAYDPGAWHFLHALYGYALVGTGMVMLFVEVLSSPYLYRDQLVALIVGSVVPTVAHVKRTFAVGPYAVVDFTPMALAFMGLTFGYALFRFELFGVVPATRHLGRRAAIDDVGVGVAIVSPDERIVELNEEAERLFGGEERTLGRSLSAAAPGVSISSAAETDGGVDTATPTGHTVDLMVEGRPRSYEVVASPIQGRHDHTVGYTVAFHDVTVREARRQRLEVLNRVLRHNLRNDMTVILGYAEVLADQLPAETASMARSIESKSHDLVGLGEKAREVESMMEAVPGTDGENLDTVELAPLIEAVVDGVDGSDRVTLDVTEGLCVETVPSVFRAVLRNAVENAVRHTDSTVDVVALIDGDGDGDGSSDSDGDGSSDDSDAGDGVVVEVRDEGAGIPEHELAVIEDGTEGPLQHGSGLGLWVIQWGSRWIGADLEFETDSDGTTVRFEF